MQDQTNPPICIASPVRRSGTTLLQRLLCSASNALIYGESCANDLIMQTNLLSSKQAYLLSSKDWRNEQLQSVLRGNVNQWIPDLMPDVDGYLQAYKQAVFSVLNHYGSFALQNGRPVWGMKMPEWNPMSLKAIQNLNPDTKIIYLYRNLKDCVRSAKKIEMVIDLNEMNRFCQTWKQFSELAKMHLGGDKVLHLNYEDLNADPERWIKEIERFTGAKNIEHPVMEIKVNTYSDDQKLEGGSSLYLAPAQLTEEELSLINSYVT